ncbi:Transcription elongation factor B polypeptide 3 [Sergentomyia squamirostris]
MAASVKEVVEHYQRSIEKTKDQKRLLHCIEKLYKLPITIDHLQETGIGKTVNNLRKEEGEVRFAARTLVAKWKAMVAQAEIDNARRQKEEERAQRDTSSDDDPGSHGDDDENHDEVEPQRAQEEEEATKDHHNSTESSSHHRSHHHHHHHHHHREKSAHSEKSSSHSESRREHKKEKRDKEKKKKKKDKHRSRSKDERKKKELAEPPVQKRKKEESDAESEESMDNTKGASFGDVLAMSDVPSPRKSPQKKYRPLEPTASSSSSMFTMHEHKRAKRDVKVAVVRPLAPLDLLKSPEKLPPLDPELVKVESFDIPQITMPQITNNYRPMPISAAVMECVFPTASGSGCSRSKPSSTATFHQSMMMTDEEAMGTSMQSKNLRTKVYSGVKTGAVYQVTSLHELCIRVLQKNIDALEYTGGVPYDLLRPVIERATPDQLFTFEHFNPYLIEDTDSLWEQHCKRRFKGAKRQEMESWREMYSRCLDEQEARLNSLTQNIKESIKTKLEPIRKTQLAYVDSIVKPPRNVLSKQNRFGTHRKISATPAARVASLSGISKNVAKAGDNRLKVAASTREYDPASSFSAPKPKRAPLMQKSLMLFKGRLKR